MINTLEYYIKNQDTITPPGCRLFHLNGDYKHKSILGGIVNMSIYLLVLCIAFAKGSQLLDFPEGSWLSE